MCKLFSVQSIDILCKYWQAKTVTEASSIFMPLAASSNSLWLDSALFSVLRVSAKTAGHPLLNMEFWINMQLMVLAAETKTRFFSHTTKHFYSP